MPTWLPPTVSCFSRLALLVLSLSACDGLVTRSVGPDCRPSAATPLGWATLGYVALFSSDGRPVDASGARVYCSQGMSPEERATRYPDSPEGYLLVGERVAFVVGSDVVRNGFTCGASSLVLRYCDAPLRVRVEMPGCASQEISWTWQENIRRNGARDISFYVPVLLRCAADAAANPTDQDASRLDVPRLDNSDVP